MAKRMVKVPRCAGFVKKGFEQVQDVFRSSIESGVERGGSFAAYYRGELVVNLWGGFADEESGRAWKDNTTSNFYSCTKSVAALVIAHMVDRGLVSYDQPVSSYWPEFAQNGKENITLKHILSMRAGLPLLSQRLQLNLIRDDPAEMERQLARQKPWDTGDLAAYSPHVFGMYLHFIVRKVDPKKRSLAQYFREEIAQPFGIDFHIGAPKAEFYRKARVQPVRQQGYDQFVSQAMDNPVIDPSMFAMVSSAPSNITKKYNDPDVVELPLPSSHGVGPAAGLAKLHGILANGGCTGDGRRLLSQPALRMLQTLVYMGPERFMGMDIFYSYGMALLPVLEGGKLHYCIGHGGFGGQYSTADLKHRTGWAYCSNYIEPPTSSHHTDKWLALEEALFRCVLALEGSTDTRRLVRKSSEVKGILQRQQSKM